MDAFISQLGTLIRSSDRRRGTGGGYLHVSWFSDVQEFVLRLALAGVVGGRYRQSTFLISEKRVCFAKLLEE